MARRCLAAATVGNYALFAGGQTTGEDSEGGTVYYFKTAVDAYDSGLIRVTPTALSAARSQLAATTIGNYAIFCGGQNGQYNTSQTNAVDAYDSGLTRTTPPVLTAKRGSLAATTVGNHALFAGGASATSAAIDAYDSNLTHTTPAILSMARSGLAATTVGNYALFGGGKGASSSSLYKNNVDAYDSSLTRTTPPALSQGRFGLAAATIGGYALFGGGKPGSSPSSVVDVYASQYETHITVPALSRYKFDSYHTEEQFAQKDTSWNSLGKLSGYIRRGGYTLAGKLPVNDV